MTDISTTRSEIATEHPFSFTGTAKEYFGIWIVNLLLSIITLGIYTAWAKVRRLRYFYGNTWLDGHNFEYHARPVQILIGRIIVVGIFVIANVISQFYPLLALVMFIPYLLALPWLLNKAFEFNARMTSYRTVRLGFKGTYLKALWVFIILPLLVPGLGVVLAGIVLASSGFSVVNHTPMQLALLGVIGAATAIGLVLITPYVSKKTNEYIANGMRFGTADFAADLSLGLLFKNMGAAVLLSLSALLIVGALAGIAVAIGGSGSIASMGLIQSGVFIVYLAVPVGYLFYAAGVRNIAFNATKIDGTHDLKSNAPRLRYAWIIVSNFIVLVLSIGLLIPWAAIRTWRFLADHTSLVSETGLDGFVSAQEAQGNVTAAEYLDIDGIDFGL
jgi:uncharacterized membrane protein YjgN (DUF898 family)